MLDVDVAEQTFELLFVASSQILKIWHDFKLITFRSVPYLIFSLSNRRTKCQLISWSYIRSNVQEKSLTACFRPQVAPLYSPYGLYSLYWSFNLPLLQSPRSLILKSIQHPYELSPCSLILCQSEWTFLVDFAPDWSSAAPPGALLTNDGLPLPIGLCDLIGAAHLAEGDPADDED